MKRIIIATLFLTIAFAARAHAQWPTVSSRAEQLREQWPVKGQTQKEAAREEFLKNIEGQKSATLKTLDGDVAELSADLDKLHERMATIKETLETTGKLLKIPGQAHQKLKTLEASLKAADKGLQTAEVVPQTRDRAKTLRAQITPSLTKVTAARQRLETIKKTTDPLSAKLLKAAERLGLADTALVALNTVALRPEPFATTVAQECVNGAASDRKECMQGKVDAKAGDIDKVVVELDRVVDILNTNVGSIEGLLDMFASIDASMKFLDGYQAFLDPLISSLDDLTEPLRKLEELMNMSIECSFPYPNPTWTNPFRISHYSLKVSMNILVQGAGAIEGEIERIVGGAFWAAAKAVGAGGVVQWLLDQANGAVNVITNALHLEFNVELGDIDKVISLPGLDDALSKIDVDFDAKVPSLDPSLPSLGFPGFASGLDVKVIDPLWFNPSGLTRADMPSVPCQQGSFLCN